MPDARRQVRILLAGVLLAAAGGSCLLWSARGSSTAIAARPARWAQPFELPGCPNLHRVSPSLWRGAQPTAEGMAELKKLGVKTVVNLRLLHSDRGEIGDLDLEYVRIRMEAWDADRDEIVRFLKVAADPEQQPVFVHCKHGADRTGTMCAIWRIAVQGWTKEEAIREMTEGGFGFHEIWGNLPRYIERLDIERIKREAGLAGE